MAWSQAGRQITVTSPLGKDVLLLEALEGEECISDLFEFKLHLLSENASISFADIVGKSMTLTLQGKGGARYINGFVNCFVQGNKAGPTLTRYQATIVPWVWNLAQTADCRIFQNKSVPDIIQQIFSDLGFSDFQMSVTGTYNPRTYCVQYRETDFEFVSRLMEEEGIFYFFQHSDGKHVMVIADAASAHQACPVLSTAVYEPAAGVQQGTSVTSWMQLQEVRPAKYTLTDYNFETPSNSLLVTRPTTVTVAKNDKLEIYDYPGEYLKTDEGNRYVRLRMEEETTPQTQIEGTGDIRSFTAGCTFDLSRHYRGDANGTYVLTTVNHRGASNILSGGADTYSNSFTCIPKAIPYRPARATPKPVIRGCQTALVVGTAGEDIDTDKYGRVLVQFYWDRVGKKDQNSSCWIRVATPWAGKQWGMIHIPRIGQEVVVAFLEGDPDQPLIVGSVYNAEQMPPYALPDNKTQSGLKTRSSLQGGTDNFNELRFEDKKGSEDIFFHAEKDFHREVENDDDLKVLHDQTIEIKNNRTETVKEGDEKVTIKQGNRTVTVETGDDTHDIKQGNRDVKVEMGNDTLTISMGNQTTKLNLGASSTEAMQSIELKVGQNSIKIDQMGVTIQGMMISIQGQVQTQVKGTMTQINGDAMLQMQGGITMIG
jgi:type VI secretion system secreted protein VgrG